MAAGGVLSGEHGIGLEKRDSMRLVFSADDLDAQAWLRDAFDPDGTCNPWKVLPRRHPLRRPPEPAPGSVDLSPRRVVDPAALADPFCSFASGGPRRSGRGGRRPDPVGGRRAPAAGTREVRRPGRRGRPRAGRDDRAGPGRHDRRRARPRSWPLPARWSPLDAGRSGAATVGGVLAVGHSGLRRLALRAGARHRARGPLRHRRRRAGQGRRPDGQERHRLRPVPAARRFARHARPARPRWCCAASPVPAVAVVRGGARRPIPSTCTAALYRPSAILWDGRSTLGAARGPSRPTSPTRRPAVLGRGFAAASPGSRPDGAGGRSALPAARARRLARRVRRPRVARRGRRRDRAPDDRTPAAPARRAAGRRRDPGRGPAGQALKARFDPTGPAQPGPDGAVAWRGRDAPGRRGARPAARRRRRAGRLRRLRAVPAVLPDLPGHRGGGRLAPGPDRRHARGAGGGAHRRDRSPDFMDLCVQCRACEVACPSAVPVRPADGGRPPGAGRRGRLPCRGGSGPATALLGHHRLLVRPHRGRGRRPARAGWCRAGWPRRLALPRLPLRQAPLRRERRPTCGSSPAA